MEITVLVRRHIVHMHGKKFFDNYLSKDRICLVNRQNLSELILRVSTPIDGVSSAPKEDEPS